MNWKPEAERMLRSYSAKLTALQVIPEDIERLASEAAAIHGATADGTPVKGGGSGREDMMLSNIMKRDELRRNLRQAQLWVETVEKALGTLSEEDQMLLDRFYVRRLRVAEVCKEMGNVDEATAYRKRNIALRRFTEAYYGWPET